MLTVILTMGLLADFASAAVVGFSVFHGGKDAWLLLDPGRISLQPLWRQCCFDGI